MHAYRMMNDSNVIISSASSLPWALARPKSWADPWCGSEMRVIVTSHEIYNVPAVSAGRRGGRRAGFPPSKAGQKEPSTDESDRIGRAARNRSRTLRRHLLRPGWNGRTEARYLVTLMLWWRRQRRRRRRHPRNCALTVDPNLAADNAVADDDDQKWSAKDWYHEPVTVLALINRPLPKEFYRMTDATCQGN